MMAPSARAARLALQTMGLGLLLGGGTLGLGLREGSIALWSFGAACLLQVPPALSLRGRILEGLGNSGLERDRVTLRVISHLLRFLSLGTAMASISDLLGERSPQAGLLSLGVSVMAVACLAALWLSKRPGASIHPALALDADRTRTLFELAALLMAGSLLGRWFPWADGATGLVMAVGLFVEGRTLARGTTLAPAVCGGGCGGCG
jgi:hypothetical protein